MKKLFLFLLVFVSTMANAQGAYALYDYDRGQYQVNSNIYEVRSIASITKLFTAITIMRSGAELDEKVKVQGKSGGKFPKGMMVSRLDLMKAMLISSDNLAAETLANTYPGGFNQYITDVNAWVKGYGLVNTSIVDASGLLPGNQSTAAELVVVVHKASEIGVIRDIANDRTAVIQVPKGKKTLKINLHNTNPTLFQFDNILLSKTGFTNPAGRCVVMLVEKGSTRYAVVILGQRNVQARSKLASELINKPPMPVLEPEPIEFNFQL